AKNKAGGRLRRSTGFVALGVGMLGVGLALASAAFTILDTLRNPYLPIEDPDRVFVVRMVGGGPGWVDPSEVVNGVIHRFARDTASYRMVAAGDSVDDQYVTAVSPGYCQLLGVSPIRGRLFHPG
ncbi:MAG TPA: hypothetical protein VD793_10370, partial [Gemmatimonadales bacterium]|nr:hypothetical protein [Gemmatimonadales bacterium]